MDYIFIENFESVGLKYNWVDRLLMNKSELEKLINAPNVHIYIMKVQEEEAGYVELQQNEEYVEIVYFGLFPEFVGKGLGKFFLNWCIKQAWSFNPNWIQLNTCELDHPNALSNYQKNGFEIFEVKEEQRRMLKKK